MSRARGVAVLIGAPMAVVAGAMALVAQPQDVDRAHREVVEQRLQESAGDQPGALVSPYAGATVTPDIVSVSTEVPAEPAPVVTASETPEPTATEAPTQTPAPVVTRGTRDVADPPVVVTEPTPTATPEPEVIMEDDPRWDCRTMGNLICGANVYAANGEVVVYLITFENGQPVAVEPRGW
ncbi:hypothetical protein [Kineococcus esterisolvens]